MPGWNSKRFAAYGLVLALAGLSAGLQVGCHKATKPDDLTQPPTVLHGIPDILATQGVPFASVTPQVRAWVYTVGVGSWVTSGFSFSVQPALPANLTLNPSTGQITGTPTTVGGPLTYTISANNSVGHGGGGTVTIPVSLGVQAASAVAASYAGTGAVSTALGSAVTLNPPTVTGGTPTGFGVNPALPAGLVLNPDTGLISGTPTNVGNNASGNYLLTVTATNPDPTMNGSANVPFVLVVTATQPAAPLGLSYPALGAATVGSPYTSPAPTLSVPALAVVYTVVSVATPPLPAGLTLDANTGVIQWTPAAAGTTTFTVAASNGGGNSTFDVTLTAN
jgi:hypothetical protein